MEIKVSPQVFSDIFVNAAQWPEWYERAKGIELLNSPDGKLNPSSIFIWNPEGKFTSTLKEFDAPYHIAWLGETDDKNMSIRVLTWPSSAL